MYFFIEPMRESDVPRVQEIERQSFSTPWSATTYLRELRSPESSRYIVARASRTRPPTAISEPEPRRNWLAGLLRGRMTSAAPPSPYIVLGYGGIWLTIDEAHITTIASAPEARGRGIGELVLNGLIDLGLDLGVTYMSLEVRVSNTIAQNLYLKYGFEPKGTRRRYYTDNNEDAMIMTTDDISTSAYQTRLHTLRKLLADRLKRQADDDLSRLWNGSQPSEADTPQSSGS